jgi:hypothetical protein
MAGAWMRLLVEQCFDFIGRRGFRWDQREQLK